MQKRHSLSTQLESELVASSCSQRLSASSVRVSWHDSNVLLSDLLTSVQPQLWIVEEAVYETQSKQLPKDNLMVLPGGEEQKTWSATEELLLAFLKRRLQRDLPVVAVGGGAHLDRVAFAAAVYQRGLPLVVVPTTLLAMVDAAVGGKNGINLAGYKNLVGTIRQPEELILDTRLLTSLPNTAWSEGFAEVIKYACIADDSLFSELSSLSISYYRKDRQQLRALIDRCLSHKLDLVTGDEEDRKGRRVFLNFGHSLAHALEAVESCSHGVAVACGMAFASWLSVEKGLLAEKKYEGLRKLLTRYGLPTYLVSDLSQLLSALRLDKKQAYDQLQFICLQSIGKPCLQRLTFSELSFYLRRYQTCFE